VYCAVRPGNPLQNEMARNSQPNALLGCRDATRAPKIAKPIGSTISIALA
jgi:hypothetical protein